MASGPGKYLDSINPVYAVAGTSLAVLAGLILLLLPGSSVGPTSNNRESELLIHCAAGMRVPVEQIAEEYESAF